MKSYSNNLAFEGTLPGIQKCILLYIINFNEMPDCYFFKLPKDG
jgi:hypothetical protein